MALRNGKREKRKAQREETRLFSVLHFERLLDLLWIYWPQGVILLNRNVQSMDRLCAAHTYKPFIRDQLTNTPFSRWHVLSFNERKRDKERLEWIRKATNEKKYKTLKSCKRWDIYTSVQTRKINFTFSTFSRFSHCIFPASRVVRALFSFLAELHLMERRKSMKAHTNATS